MAAKQPWAGQHQAGWCSPHALEVLTGRGQLLRSARGDFAAPRRQKEVGISSVHLT
jgi:hypothetical protein